MELRGAGVVVTGGASGLGEATARRLVSSGAEVAVLDRSAGRGAKVAEELGAHFVQADVTDADAVEAAMAAAATLVGPLRVLVNCAGGGPPPRPLLGDRGEVHDLAAWQATVDLNLTGTFNTTRFAVRHMAQADPVDGLRGVVVNTSSVAAFEGASGLVAYSSAKAALSGFTISAARAYAACGVRVMTIAPGSFLTRALLGLSERRPEVLDPPTLAPRRLGRPEEFAALVEHIARNDYLNAEVVRLDGGFRGGPEEP